MAFPSITAEDVALIHGMPVDQERHQKLVDAALALIDARVPTASRRIENGTMSPDVVAVVAAGMIARVLSNPGAAEQVSQSAGPHSVSTSFGGGLTLTKAEIAALEGRRAAGRVGSVRMGLSGWQIP